VVDFELGGALMALETDENESAGGFELRAGALFHAGPVDLGLMYRKLYVDADLPGGGSETYDYDAFQFTIGGAWGYPRN
jgi:hypothetical protein